MLIWLRRYVAWLFVGVAVVGGAALLWGWHTSNRLQTIMADGKDAAALIEGASSVTRKDALSFTVNLAWKNDAGVVLRAQGVPVTRTFADQIISDGVLIVPSTKIRYLVAGKENRAVVVDDAPRQADSAQRMMMLGLGGLVLGLFGGWLFGIGPMRVLRRSSAP